MNVRKFDLKKHARYNRRTIIMIIYLLFSFFLIIRLKQ